MKTKTAIKPEELRKGNIIRWNDESEDDVIINYVYENTDYSEEWFVNYFGGEEPDGDALLSEFNPMPLTPEWLERAGFDDDKRIDAFSTETDDKCYFIRKEENIWVLYQYNGFDDDTGDHITNVEFLHQLQNLFFALTQTDLIFKPQQW